MFTVLGAGISLIFLAVFGPPIGLFPLIFLIIGLGILAIPYMAYRKEAAIKHKGKRYPAKVYGYVEDSTITINGQYPINIKARYFDDKHQVREAVIPTRFPKGNVPYAVGMTLDILEYQGMYDMDKASVRSERLKEEEVLMDNRPLEPELADYIAITCPNCGASFKAVKGYTGRCPYCDSYINA